MIPNFDHNQVLPPHLGNPVSITDLSPYLCTSEELCHKFCTSPERTSILKNYLHFREKIRSLGLINAIQWIDGSFLEDIEKQEKRAPRDLDCITIYWEYDMPFQIKLVGLFPEFYHPVLSKRNYQLDHYPFDAGFSPVKTVEMTRYWSQLFSHNRNGVWKGLLSLQLNTITEDANALNYIQSLTP